MTKEEMDRLLSQDFYRAYYGRDDGGDEIDDVIARHTGKQHAHHGGDAIDRTIARHTGKGDGRTEEERSHDDEVERVLVEHTSQHASERLARRRREATPDRVRLARRGTSLTILSGDAAFQSVAATLQEDERLVVADDGHGVEIVAGVEEDEELEGTIEVILND